VHAFVVVITQNPKEYGSYASEFRNFVNESGDIPGVKKGASFSALILSGDQSKLHPNRNIKDGNKLIKVKNLENDKNALNEAATGTPWGADYDTTFSEKLKDNDGNSNLALDLAIIAEFDKYNEKAPYRAIPSAKGDDNNSNSFARTIPERAGAVNVPKDLPGYDPGTEKRIPDRYFTPIRPETTQ
jgi:hypothetical protein